MESLPEEVCRINNQQTMSLGGSMEKDDIMQATAVSHMAKS